MARLALPVLALALGAAAAVGLVSCGGRSDKGLLPGDTADQIVSNLDRVDQLASQGSCASAAVEVATIQGQIASLPASVDPRLRDRLTAGAQRLATVVNSPGACETSTTTSSEPTTTESTTTTEKKPKTTTTTTSSTTTTTSSTSTTSTLPGPPTGGTPGGVGALPPGQEKKLFGKGDPKHAEGEGG